MFISTLVYTLPKSTCDGEKVALSYNLPLCHRRHILNLVKGWCWYQRILTFKNTVTTTHMWCWNHSSTMQSLAVACAVQLPAAEMKEWRTACQRKNSENPSLTDTTEKFSMTATFLGIVQFSASQSGVRLFQLPSLTDPPPCKMSSLLSQTDTIKNHLFYYTNELPSLLPTYFVLLLNKTQLYPKCYHDEKLQMHLEKELASNHTTIQSGK